MTLRFFEEAFDEVEEIRAWYRKHSEAAEAGFLDELDHAIDQVTLAPLRWPLFVDGTRRYVFPTYPYSLIYFTENGTVHVVAIAHDRRKPTYWRKRLR